MGHRAEIWWGGDKRFYGGKVAIIHGGHWVTVRYDDGEVTEEDLVKETWHLSTEQEGGGREVGGGEDGKAMDVQEDDPGTFDSDDEHTAVPPVVVGGEDGEDGKSAGGPIILDAYPAESVDSEDGDDGVDGDQSM